MSVFPLTKIPRMGYHKGDGTRWFGASRGGRKHAACDLLSPQYKPILAVDHGTVIYRGDFYKGTNQLVVDHGHFTVRYGEVDKEKRVKGIKKGSPVKPGEVIAYVGRLKMLHFEMYKGTDSGNLTRRSNKENYLYVTPQNYQRRSDLIDPTPYLDRWKLYANVNKWVGDAIDDVAESVGDGIDRLIDMF